MLHEGTSKRCHGDGDWKWANETAKSSEQLPDTYDGMGDSGTCTPIHKVSTPQSEDTSMRRTRSRVAQEKTVMQQQEDTLQEVAEALATGSMPSDYSDIRHKRQGLTETVKWDVRKSVTVTESEGLGSHSKTRRLLPIFDRPMPSHIGHVDPSA